MPPLLPTGLFDRLRAQMMLLLAVGILVVDVVVLIGVQQVQARVVDDALDRAAAGIEALPPRLPVVNVGVVAALAPSDLYVGYVAADGSVPTSSAPTSTSDVPDVESLVATGALAHGRQVRLDAPGGTAYDLLRVTLPPETRIRLQDGSVTTPVESVVLGYPRSTMERTLRGLLLVEAVSLVLVLGAAFLLSRWFVHAGLRPLRRIGRTASAIATGRTDERIAVGDDDRELAEVARTLNQAFDTRQESEDRMRDFVADASHELRTPLASVRGWTDLYREGGLDDWDGVDAAMQNIYTEAGRMEVLVEDMLVLARYDAAPGSVTTTPVAVGPLLADLVDAVRLLHPGHGYALDGVPVGHEGLRAHADPAALRRALSNLVVNAGRHTPAGTRVRVSRLVAGDTVEVRVADDGPGLTAAERASAFDRFWRSDRSRQRPGGSGLGLAISRSILRAAGGDLRLEESDGGGLTAVVVLRRA